MGKTQVGINSWLESHEEKLRRVPTKSEEKIQENKKRDKMCLHRPMVMDKGEGKKLNFLLLLRIFSISRGNKT